MKFYRASGLVVGGRVQSWRCWAFYKLLSRDKIYRAHIYIILSSRHSLCCARYSCNNKLVAKRNLHRVSFWI